MFIIYSKKTGEVFNRFHRTATDAEGILKGYFGEDESRWAGYHPSVEAEVYELTEKQNKAWDDNKLYSFDEKNKELTERELPEIPEAPEEQ